MATAEAETSRDEQAPPGGSVYDGFISYSHAADDFGRPGTRSAVAAELTIYSSVSMAFPRCSAMWRLTGWRIAAQRAASSVSTHSP